MDSPLDRMGLEGGIPTLPRRAVRDGYQKAWEKRQDLLWVFQAGASQMENESVGIRSFKNVHPRYSCKRWRVETKRGGRELRMEEEIVTGVGKSLCSAKDCFKSGGKKENQVPQ